MFSDAASVLRAVDSGFAGASVLVVGDVMLDRYVWGDVARISPEAPVPVVRVKSRSVAAGGAANVAANLAGLGVRTSLIGVRGNDAFGITLSSLLAEIGVSVDGLIAVAGRPTITKTRIIGGHQQMLRLDDENVLPIGAAVEDALIDAVEHGLEAATVVVLSDYAKGVLTGRCCREIIARAAARGIPVLVDPKGTDYEKYSGATAVTPNVKELAAATGESEEDRERLYAAATRLRERFGIGKWVITEGERGISLLNGASSHHFPATAREVFDVSGAGDTVMAVLAASIAAQLPIEDAVRLANVAGGVVVGKVGTSPIERTELIDAVDRKRSSEQARKIVEIDRLLKWVADWRARGERIVFTNGCFDLIHAGHVTYLEKAREEGHRLVVGINTDQSVRRLKGSNRPIVHELDRARVLGSLSSIDAVVFFDTDTPLDLIQAIRPDVLVKGDDYSFDDVVGSKEIRDWNGRVVLVPRVEGRSTTGILDRILELA